MNQLTKKILVISHANCDDGFGAAFAAWKKFGDNADYWFAYYGAPPPNVKDKEVYILDFSYSRETLLKIKSEAKSLQVIDHHKTAEKNLEGLDFCIFNQEKSGAMLAWEYFHPGIEPGILFFHIQDRDLWKFECEHTKPFSYFLRQYPQDFATWNALFCSLNDFPFVYEEAKKEGAAIQRYFYNQLESNIRSTKHQIHLDGYIGLVANLPGMFSSEAGELMAKESGTFGMTYFIYKDGMVKCSLRSTDETKCNVRVIAEKFGGGGHDRASGFTLSKEELNKLIENNKC